MKRLFFSLLAALISVFAAGAYNAAIRDIDVKVRIHPDGCVSINERWDVTAASGTEWYLVRNNLGDIKIKNLSVSEGDLVFENEGEWDVDRGIQGKAWKCGVVTKSNGAELCWGIGSLGDHVFSVSYDMTNAVKSLQDYDMLHMQFVSPGLSSHPDHVRVSVELPGVQLDTTVARIWGFGYKGEAYFKDGKAVFESGEAFGSNSSVISLIRFDKGLVEPESVQDRAFQDALDVALAGSDYGDDVDDDFGATFLGLLFMGLFVWMFMQPIKKSKVSGRKMKAILGCSAKKVSWSRELPFGGDLGKAEYTLKRLGQSDGNSHYTSALILRLVQQGYLVPQQTESNMDLLITDKDPSPLDDADLMFFTFLKSAAGDNGILERKEFSTWASRNSSKLRSWSAKLSNTARSSMCSAGELDGKYNFTEPGQAQARNTLGFKLFLQDFTLMSERGTPEVTLWQDYLAFGALYGIADKVAKQLKQINPDVFQDAVASTVPYDMVKLVRLSEAYRTTVRSNVLDSGSSYSGGFGRSGGYGGHSSFGGGGGFSGGGRGGGSR